MKLLTQTGLYMVTLSMILFFASGIAFYFVFRTFTNQALDRELEQMRTQVMEQPESFFKAVQDGVNLFEKIEFVPINNAKPTGITYHDTIFTMEGHESPEPVRFVKFFADFGESAYEVKIYRSKISSDDLTIRITGLITLLAFFFTLGIFLLNRYGFRSTWKDFWRSLRKVQNFKAGNSPPDFEESEIDEFNTLNQELKKMTGRIARDYRKLESFTTHTTHEFQTPLAVIRSKVEILLQSENLNHDQLREIQNIDKYASQLSRLNQSLSLLFNIENQQFEETKVLYFSQEVKNHSDFLLEQAELRGIHVNIDLHEDAGMMINPSLADVLLLNLFRNALFHNIPDGTIDVILKKQSLEIINTGPPAENGLEKVFEEFVKGKQSNGLGLGLAIVKRICDLYGIDLDYTYNNQKHSFLLSFPEA